MYELHLFAGAGGGILGGMLLGHTCVCAVEIDKYCRKDLLQRQRDGILPKFPIWDDVCTFNGLDWRGRVDVVCGGFPCQDISCAGKGDGLDGERSGLWTEFARIIGEVRPRYAFVENSPMLTLRGLDRVLGDLSSLGYDARWGVVSAADAGAPQRRERIWIVAYSGSQGHGEKPRILREGESEQERPHVSEFDLRRTNVADTDSRRCEEQLQRDGNAQRAEQSSFGNHVNGCHQDVAVADEQRLEGAELQRQRDGEQQRIIDTGWWKSEPDVGRVANGVASRVDRLKALGNGQVPAVAALAWRILMNEALTNPIEQVDSPGG